MSGRIKLILYAIVVANIASSENVKSFKYVKGEPGYTNSSRDQELKLKGSLILLDDKNLGRRQEAFERTMGSPVHLKKQSEVDEFNSQKMNKYNEKKTDIYKPNTDSSIYWGNQHKNDEHTQRKSSDFNKDGNNRNVDEVWKGYKWASEKDMTFEEKTDIYKPNMDSSIYWGNQHKNDEHTPRKNSDFNKDGNDRNADELWKGYKWTNEKDMSVIRDSKQDSIHSMYSNDYKPKLPNLNIDVQTRPKPDWESFGEKQAISLASQNIKHFTDPYSDLRNPYKYARGEYMTGVNNHEMRNQNIYNVDSQQLASSHSRYPVHRIFDFNSENNMQHSNFYKTDKGLVINLKTECPRETKHGVMHKIFFSSEPHMNSFTESNPSYFPGTPLIPSSPVYYL